jgi:hypothetical protein
VTGIEPVTSAVRREVVPVSVEVEVAVPAR